MANGRKTGGRVAGTPNKINGDVKAMILGALTAAGGEEYLLKQAHENPTAFMTLLGKVLPLQVAGDAEAPPVSVTFHWADAVQEQQPEPAPDAEPDADHQAAD
jgi:hypothetical protein